MSSKKSKIIIVALALIIVCQFAYKQTVWAGEYSYISENTIQPEFIIPPVEAQSEAWKKEATGIIELQKNAIKEEVAAAEEESKLKPPHLLKVLGDGITEENHPATLNLMVRTKIDCEKTVHKAKDFWKTTRPYLSDNNIKALIHKHTSGAYPSGHTACSRVWAEVLGQVVPEKRIELRAKAKQSADYRVLGGQHWPHDLVGGEQVALLLFGAFQQSDKYQADLKAAQAEWTSK